MFAGRTPQDTGEIDRLSSPSHSNPPSGSPQNFGILVAVELRQMKGGSITFIINSGNDFVIWDDGEDMPFALLEVGYADCGKKARGRLVTGLLAFISFNLFV